MPQIPFPTGLSEVANIPKSRHSLINCFDNGQGAIIGRPGIDTIRTTQFVARGQFVWRNQLYQIVSNRLIRIDNTTTGDFTDIGFISGSLRVETAIGFTHAILAVRGGDIYSLDASGTLTNISAQPNYAPSNSVVYINGRFVFVPTDGTQPAFFTNANSLTVDGTNFFDAEELPDENQVCFNLRNTLYIGGTDSFELFRDTGATPVPFSRLSGARMDYGFIGAETPYADTFAFIGREREQDFGIYLVGQGRANKISNEAIDLILKRHTLSQLQSAVGNRFKWNGYDILTFTLATDSFGFFNGNWFRLMINDGGSEIAWNAGFINQFQGSYYSASDGFIGRLSDANTEYGKDVPRYIDIPFQHEDNDFFACQSISMNVSQGFNATSPVTVGLAVSRNNVEYGEFLYRDLGKRGEYTQHLEWNPPGGMGAYDGFMGLRIYTSQDVNFDANGLYAFFRG